MPVNTSAIQIEFNQPPPELTRNSSKCTFEFRAEILSLSRKSLYYCRLSLFSPCSTVYISISCPYLLKDEYTESFEINQLLDYEQPTAYIVANDEYSTDTSLTPVLTANKGFILGYTDEKFGIYQKGECIIFDDFTMDAKYVSFPFKVKSSAIKILTAKPNVNLRFMFEYLSYWELKSEGHKRHYISEIASLVIELPSKERQSIIASLMTSLNSKLDIEAKTKIRYEEQKRYLLSQMFI